MFKKLFKIFPTCIIFFVISGNYLFSDEEKKILKLEADSVKINQNIGKAEFDGNVTIFYSDLMLKSDYVIVSYDISNPDKTDISSLKAEGNLLITKNENILKGDNGFYNFKKNQITLEGNVILNQKNNVVSGEKLIFNTKTGDIQMFGPVKTIFNEER